MRIKLLIAFLLIGFIGNSQIRYLHPWYHFENKVTVNDLFADSVFYAPLIDTGTFTPSRIGALTVHSDGLAYIWDGGAWVILAGSADGNNYPSSMSFSGGILTVPRNGLSDLTATIDGRYLKITDTTGLWLNQGTANNLYAEIEHGHTASDISDLTSYVRNLFSGGTGITYNDSTGVISWNGSGSGITSLNGLSGTTQTFSGVGLNISSVGTDHEFTVDSLLYTTRLRSIHIADSLQAINSAALALKLNTSDTTNKWVQDVYARNDSLFVYKNGTETFIDSIGGTGGGGSGDYNLIVEQLGTGEEILVPRNDTLYGRTLEAGFGVIIDTLANGGLRATIDSANADVQAWIALYGNDGNTGGSDVIDSIQEVADDGDMTGNFAFNTSLNRLTYKTDSFYLHIAITDSVRHTEPAGGGDASVFLDFTTAGAVTEDPEGTWTRTGAVPTLLSTTSLPSSGDGYIKATYATSGSNTGALIGLDAVNTLTTYTSFDYGLYVSAGTYRRIDNGTITDIGVSAVEGHQYRLNRTGSTITAQTSSDGSSWTTIHTFSATTTAQLWGKGTIVTTAAVLKDVKGEGFE